MFRHCLDLKKKNVKKNCDCKTFELFREIPYTGWLVLYMWLAEIPLYQRLVMPQPLFKEMESHCQDCWNVRISVWRNFSAKPKNGPIWPTWRKTSETRFYFWNAVLEYLVWFTKNSSQFSSVCLRTQPMTHLGWKLPGKQSKIFFSRYFINASSIWTLSDNYWAWHQSSTVQKCEIVTMGFDTKIEKIVFTQGKEFSVSNVPIVPTSSCHSSDFYGDFLVFAKIVLTMEYPDLIEVMKGKFIILPEFWWKKRLCSHSKNISWKHLKF